MGLRQHNPLLMNRSPERQFRLPLGDGFARERADSAAQVRLAQPGCSLLDLGALLADLEDLLRCRVDLVTDDGLKPRLRERVLREAIPL